MNHDHRHAALDQAARALYREASAQLSPRTLSRLRPRAAASRPVRRLLPSWQLTAACAAVCTVAVGVYRLAAPEPQPQAVAAAPVPVAPASAPLVLGLYEENALASYEEDPELFLWLASAEAEPLAME